MTPDLSIPEHPEVFVVGDLARVSRDNGHDRAMGGAGRYPGGACRSRQRACAVGRPTRSFSYFNKGDLATIGQHRAVADFGFMQVTGFLAWTLWLFVHILYLVGFRNRVSVLVQWAYAYFTYQRGMRLITNYARQWEGTEAVGGRYLSPDALEAMGRPARPRWRRADGSRSARVGRRAGSRSSLCGPIPRERPTQLPPPRALGTVACCPSPPSRAPASCTPPG